MPPPAAVLSLFRGITKRRFRPATFLTFVLVKALCSLAMLNFYMASRISIFQPEGSLPSMMIRHRGGGVVVGDAGGNAEVELNSTSQAPVDKDLSQGYAQRKPDIEGMITPSLSDGTLQGKERLWDILQTRNVTRVEADYWASIPTWDTVLGNIYRSNTDEGGDNASPIIHGLETCEAFQNITSSNPSQRRVAPAGLFNTGTNYLSVLLEYNCQNPYRVKKFHGNARRGHGNEWEVPWGKHSPASSRGTFFKNPDLKYSVDEVLPVVLVRNPYGWMKSMCRNPYTATWRGVHDKETCPQLKTKPGGDGADDGLYIPVDVKYGSGATHHQSLGHLWNDWFGEYFYSIQAGARKEQAPFPRLMIRFEDIIFFPYEVTKQVCMCAGGVLGHRHDDKDVANKAFHYVVRSAKAGMGHGPASQRNGLMDSWARYGSSDPKDVYSEEVAQIAEEVLDPLMMEAFGYG